MSLVAYSIISIVPFREDHDIQPGSSIQNAKGKKCGKLRDSCGKFGLAMLRIPDVINKQPLSIENEAHVTLNARIPSWWNQDDVIVQQAVGKSA